jgi:hypothetical protein
MQVSICHTENHPTHIEYNNHSARPGNKSESRKPTSRFQLATDGWNSICKKIMAQEHIKQRPKMQSLLTTRATREINTKGKKGSQR